MGVLRFIGIVNAAVWFGSVFYFTLVAGPGLFSADMLQLFGGAGSGSAAKYWAGSVAQVLLSRYYNLNLICGSVAIGHLLAEWVLTGRPMRRRLLILILVIFSFGLTVGFWLQPKMHQWHWTMYGIGGKVTVVQAEKARRSFHTWHGIAQLANLMVLGGLTVVLWQLTEPVPTPRFMSQTKFHWE
jgi:hypothetical protein